MDSSAGRIFQERQTLVPDDGKSESAVSQIREQVCQLEEFAFAANEFLPAPPPAAAPKHPGAPELEDLGKQSFSGLETVGTWETIVIPTGQIGNNSPLFLKREFWYSPKLGVNLISKRQDPRSDIQNFEVTDMALGEPDAKLFEVPSGSKILDLRKPPELSSTAPPAPN